MVQSFLSGWLPSGSFTTVSTTATTSHPDNHQKEETARTAGDNLVCPVNKNSSKNETLSAKEQLQSTQISNHPETDSQQACPYNSSSSSSSSGLLKLLPEESKITSCPAHKGEIPQNGHENVTTATAQPLSFLDTEQEPVSSLPTRRQVSSIPKSSSDQEYWVYPSQQQFHEAVKRKQGRVLSEDEMSVLVPMHNVVNEVAWRRILEWERKYHETCGNPTLKRFLGKPEELSPRARFQYYIMGRKLPFDRHDWVVDRCGQDVRYVLDFYQGPPKSNSLVSMHVDVRPALDSWQAAFDRAEKWMRDNLLD